MFQNDCIHSFRSGCQIHSDGCSYRGNIVGSQNSDNFLHRIRRTCCKPAILNAIQIVDIIADDAAQLEKYHKTFDSYHTAQKQLRQLQDELELSRQQTDFLRFQYNELTEARLTSGEQEELELRSNTMSHAEDIKSALYETDNALSGDNHSIVAAMKTATSALHSIEHVFPAATELAARMETSYIELKDIAQEVSSRVEDIDFDPAELDSVNTRLDRIYDLQKKYHADSIDELIALRDELGQKLTDIDNSDDIIAELQAKCQHLKISSQKEANCLTKIRTKATKQIEKEMRERLIPLGMPNVRFAIDIQPVELRNSGQDQVSFLFSANTSTPLQPIAQVASGGEIARVMLSLKAMISGAVKLPTIIFDEIDTGVSGKMAECMANIMQEMGAGGRQVLSITHLPQIAARGKHHYKVYKEETAQGTVSHMQKLIADERIAEIAQMLSGSDISEAAIQNAKELLKTEK